MILNLSPNFRPLRGAEIIFESFTFPGGEPHIKIKPGFDNTEPLTITQRINSFNDLGLLCMAADALQRMGAKADTLFIPYFPAARQDRVMVAGEPLSVKVYAEIINHLGFREVLVFDPHSEVLPAILDNCKIVPNHLFIEKVLEIIGREMLLISPDGGALKKIYKLSEYLGGMEVVECGKIRTVANGQLTGFKVFAEDLKGRNCLIVDDICDGGGTFSGLAQSLKQKNAGKLFLAVSHGIFSKGLDVLGDFERIFSTNSFRDRQHPTFTQFDLKYLLP